MYTLLMVLAPAYICFLCCYYGRRLTLLAAQFATKPRKATRSANKRTND